MLDKLNLKSQRAKRARLAVSIGRTGYLLLASSAAILTGLGILLMFVHHSRYGDLLIGLGLICLVGASWYNKDLQNVEPDGDSLDGRLSPAILSKLNPSTPINSKLLWDLIAKNPQTLFLTNHLLLNPTVVGEYAAQTDLNQVLSKAYEISNTLNNKTIEPAYIASAFLASPLILDRLLKSFRLTGEDVMSVTLWADRLINTSKQARPYFGGIGRDWANGYTPLLIQFGTNISLTVESHGNGYYSWMTKSQSVNAVKNAFSQGAIAVALVGPDGVGKTSHTYALAELLLSEANDPNLRHVQIIQLDSSVIISSAKGPGDLEQLVPALMSEAIRAGNVIIFLDNAQLFFSQGPGAFDVSKILLPIIQNGSTRLIMAITPDDLQRLKNSNAALAGMLTPVILNEPSEADTLRILQDTATSMEIGRKLLIAYDALREAYRLSGRYDQDIAYPGRAINLLQLSLGYASDGVVTAESVQQAIEQTKGVKVSSAGPAEADKLLHLEDEIHKRMINQSRAVSVVADALKRARAGVANPKRPIGSFLFLGPTGVGKTELARSIAAVHFGNEANMIRLDMTEYQQAEDAKRLLDNGDASASLLIKVRQQPFSVVLLDEVEKANPNVLNLLLQMLDEGMLTDLSGKPASFKDCIIIATSNAGANDIREHIARGEQLESFESQFTDQLISSNQFKAELINRFDAIVLFRPLNATELAQVVSLMMAEVNKTLENQKVSVELTPAAVQKIVEMGYDARLGARPMRRVLQSTVENVVADRILRGKVQPGQHIVMDVGDLLKN